MAIQSPLVPRLYTLLCLFLMAFCFSADGGQEVLKGPAPEWAAVDGVDLPEGKSEEDGSVRFLAVDLQEHLEEKTVYQAFKKRIVTAAGVEESSQISVDFQPAFQTLVWHRLDVERGGVVQDRLPRAEFEVIRQEKGLDRQLYDGQLTAHVILRDIRRGDTLSYSFSISGQNPIFHGHTQGFYQLAFGVPVDWIHRSVTWDAGQRTLSWQCKEAEPEIVEEDLGGGMRRISYTENAVPKFPTEENTPDWFADYPYLEVSDYPSWGDFGKWAEEIYLKEDPLPPALVAICDTIRAEGGTQAEMAVKTLRWVQENVRYLGSFFGEHTHAPYSLAEIDVRRFGDCKDKGMMTVAMLNYLGLDAAPALVNTDDRGKVGRYLPGHSNFDHLIVHLRLAGSDYWLDPTRAFQRGTLESQYSPDYGLAFVIRSGANALKEVRQSGIPGSFTEIREVFAITDMEGNGTLTVETISNGNDADAMRRILASDSRPVLEERYRDFYRQDYPGLEVAAPLAVKDEEDSNRITTQESYRLVDFWKEEEADGGGQEKVGAFYARNMLNYLPDAEIGKRKRPFGISYPTHIRQTVDISLPEKWNLPPEEENTLLNAARFSFHSKMTGRTVSLSYEYQTLADHVEAGEYPTFAKAVDKMGENIYYALSTGAEGSGIQNVDGDKRMMSNVLLVVLLMIGIAFGLALATGLYFWDPQPREAEDRAPMGLGGWLILPMVGCVIMPIMVLVEISTFFIGANGGDFTLFSTHDNQLGWTLYFCGGIFFQGILLALSLLQIQALFSRRTTFPWLFIGILVIYAGQGLVLLAIQKTLDGVETEGLQDLIGSIVELGVWGTYMLVSQRVKATFVIRRRMMGIPLPPILPSGPAQS